MNFLLHLLLLVMPWILANCSVSEIGGEEVSLPKDLTTAFPQSCKPRKNKLWQGDCPEGYLCVPNASGVKASCLKECGANEQGNLVKRKEVCGHHKKCMLLRRPDLSAFGMFCLTPQKQVD